MAHAVERIQEGVIVGVEPCGILLDLGSDVNNSMAVNRFRFGVLLTGVFKREQTETTEEHKGEETMGMIKLTETHHISPAAIGEVIFDQKYGMVHFELRHQTGESEPTEFYGEEATEAWANWKAYFDRMAA